VNRDKETMNALVKAAQIVLDNGDQLWGEEYLNKIFDDLLDLAILFETKYKKSVSDDADKKECVLVCLCEGIITVNEAREQMGFPKLEGGNVYLKHTINVAGELDDKKDEWKVKTLEGISEIHRKNRDSLRSEISEKLKEGYKESEGK